MLGEQEITFESRTLVVDVRDLLLDVFKSRPKPWGQMNQEEQADTAEGLEVFSQKLVQSVVELVASRGQHTLTAQLEKFTAKSGEYQATLKLVGGPNVALDLAQFNGKSVLIVDADAAPFYGVARPADIDRDQPEMFDEPEPVMGEEVDLEAAAEG
jgi:hypothetical protein